MYNAGVSVSPYDGKSDLHTELSAEGAKQGADPP